MAETFSLDVQEAEENFDLTLIGALEIDVVPHLGDTRVPDSLVSQLAKVLHQGSRLYEEEGGSTDSHVSSNVSANGNGCATPRSWKSLEFENVDMEREFTGNTHFGSLVPRERFSFWCFDLLFLICSNTTKGIYTIYFLAHTPD